MSEENSCMYLLVIRSKVLLPSGLSKYPANIMSKKLLEGKGELKKDN